jgi:preprotein translocase subunit SecY
MVRKPSAFGIAAISLIYFGSLFYWQWDALTGTDRDAMVFAAQLIAVAVGYVAYVMWCVQRDLPEGIKSIKFFGATAKFLGWLAIMGGFFYWCLQDDSLVGYLFVGVGLMGLGTAFSLACLAYTGEESSRLFALKRLVDVYPTITKPDGHVRFGQKMWTTTLVLIIYFAMTNVMIWGLAESTMDIFSSFRAIMAGPQVQSCTWESVQSSLLQSSCSCSLVQKSSS